MKSIFISELKAGVSLTNEPFLLHEVNGRKTRDGRPFLLLNIRDKSGSTGGVFWDVPDYVSSWAQSGSVAFVTGRVNKYKDALQISVTDMNRCEDVDLADFLPSSSRSTEEMVAELREHITTLDAPWQELVSFILLEDDFLPRYVAAPAARGMHHAYIGGLLEHSLSMTVLAKQLSQHYPYVNQSLLVAGTLLHDMGKVEEYELSDSFRFSEDGRLVGHIVRAIVLIETAASQINFPEKELRQLVHLVASHHGKQEWGSPVVPKTLEAILLHQLDLLDSRVAGFFDHINNDNGDSDWTVKSSFMFGTELQKPAP